MKRWFAFGLGVLLAGCGSSPTLEPPTPLMELEQPLEIETAWVRHVGGGAGHDFLRLRPVVGEEAVYGAERNGRVFAFGLATGRELWRKSLAVVITSGLSVTDDKILLGTGKGEVLMLASKDGSELWRTVVTSEVLSPPQLADGVVVVRTVDGRVFGISAADGRRLWVYDRGVPLLTLRGTGTPVIDSGVVLAGFDDGKLVALTLNEGTPLWEAVIATPSGRTELERMVDLDGDPVVANGVAYVTTYQGRIAAVRLDSGRLLWAREGSSYAGLTLDSGRVYVSTADGEVVAMDRASGTALWTQKDLRYRALSAPVRHRGFVVVGDLEGYVHWLSAEDGSLVARTRVQDTEDVFREYDPPPFYDAYEQRRDILATPVAAGESVLIMDRRGVLALARVTQQ